MNFLIVLFYRPLYFLIKSVLILFQPIFGQKMKGWIQLRKEPLHFPDLKQSKVLWLHASSGEIEYLKSFIRDYKKANPSTCIVVSYSSPSAPRLFENIKSSVDIFFPMPWDQPQKIQNLIRKINPTAVFFGRTDLWPEFIRQLSKHKIKTYIISYNPTLSFLNRLWIRLFLKNFTAIFCIHQNQEQVLKALLPETVSILMTGDTRFDQVFWRLQQPTKIAFQLTDPYVVFGSTWKEDEIQFLPYLNEIKKLGYKIVLSPHEIDTDNIVRLEKILTQLGLTFQKFSDLSSTSADIILLDRVGFLADFYRLADAAFIGGSFKSKVHSVMEPLCCAIPVITGPFIYNSPEAMRYHQVIINELRVVQMADNGEQILTAFKNIQSIQKNDFKKLLIGNLEKNRYATQKIMNFISG